MDEVKLLPCPFCGGEASGYPHFEDANSSTPGCYIVCHECDVTPDGCYRKATEWDQAVTIWNTRAAIADTLPKGEDRETGLRAEQG